MASIQGKFLLNGDALARVAAIAAAVKRPEALWKEVGRRVANLFRDHFRKLDAKPNKLAPGRREHYWAQVREAVGTPAIEGQGAGFSINDSRYGIKVYGGTIVPREASALAIPINALGYARRPAVFEEETGHKLFRPKGKRVLMADLGNDGKAVAIYVLAKSATVPADPEAMPAESDVQAACVDQAEKFFARQQQAA